MFLQDQTFPQLETTESQKATWKCPSEMMSHNKPKACKGASAQRTPKSAQFLIDFVSGPGIESHRRAVGEIRKEANDFLPNCLGRTLQRFLALGVSLRRTNSCTKLLAARSPVLINTFSKSSPAPRFEAG